MGGLFSRESSAEEAWAQSVLETVADPEKRDSAGFEVLTAGFANHVLCGSKDGRKLAVKVYTDLVLLRIDEDAIGAADVLASQCGVGPHVLLSNKQGLVMEFLPGRTLEEPDVHCGNFQRVQAIARELEKLHRQPVPSVCSGEPMLWRTTDKMLKAAKLRPDLLPEGIPSMEAIEAEVAAAKAALDKQRTPVVFGHNDFKPSNVIEHDGVVRLIDFELGGPNYRGFDWMKLFRTADSFSEEDLRQFLKAYAACAHMPCTSEDDLELLLRETWIFLPLTWLEAFVFFLALAQYKPEQLSKWHDLARHRWMLYQQTRDKLFSEADK